MFFCFLDQFFYVWQWFRHALGKHGHHALATLLVVPESQLRIGR